jgi:hypothetical protein
MGIMDRIRELFGGKQSGAEQAAVTGGTVGATTRDDPAGDVDSSAGSGWSGGGESGGGDGGGSAAPKRLSSALHR